MFVDSVKIAKQSNTFSKGPYKYSKLPWEYFYKSPGGGGGRGGIPCDVKTAMAAKISIM